MKTRSAAATDARALWMWTSPRSAVGPNSGFFAHFDRLLRASATRTAREHRQGAKVPAPLGARIGGFRNHFSIRVLTVDPMGGANSRGPDVH
jgi:hypothetical protein